MATRKAMGTKSVKPKKDTMAKNVKDHMGGKTMGKKVATTKTGGRRAG